VSIVHGLARQYDRRVIPADRQVVRELLECHRADDVVVEVALVALNLPVRGDSSRDRIPEKREVAHFAVEQLVDAEPDLVTEQELHALAPGG
jgi:hypothetical protein